MPECFPFENNCCACAMLKKVYYFLLLPLLLFANTRVLAQGGNAVDSLKTVLAKQEVDSVRARTLVALASQLRHSNTTEALTYAREALGIVNEMGLPKRKAVVLQILGLIYNTRTDYKNSIYYTLQALRIYESVNDTEGKANALNALGLVYFDLKKYDMARDYFLQSMHLIEASGMKNKLGMIYCNLGNLLASENKFEESIYYHQKALENSLAFTDTNATCINLINLGDAYLSHGNAARAKDYFLRVLALSSNKTRDYEQLIAYTFLGLGKLELMEHQSGNATNYLLKAKQIAEQGSINDLLVDIYKELAGLYQKKNDYKQAFEYNMLYNAMKDSVLNVSTIRQLSDIQKAYEVEKRDKEIQLINKDKEIAATKARTSRLIYVVVFAFVITVIMIVARNMVLKHKIRNKILSEEKAVIEKDNAKLLRENTEAKFETLKSKINPHFLFNSLSTLSSLVQEGEEAALQYIEKFSDLYRIILETGEAELITLEQELKIVQNYIYLRQMECGENLLVHIDIPDSALSRLLPPFAVQMAVENTIKHNIITGKNKLSLFIHISDETVVIENNLQKKSSINHSTKTGQKNILGRYRLISNIDPLFVESKTSYTVTLPLFKHHQNPGKPGQLQTI